MSRRKKPFFPLFAFVLEAVVKEMRDVGGWRGRERKREANCKSIFFLIFSSPNRNHSWKPERRSSRYTVFNTLIRLLAKLSHVSNVQIIAQIISQFLLTYYLLLSSSPTLYLQHTTIILSQSPNNFPLKKIFFF